MKKLLFIILILLGIISVCQNAWSQNVGINTTGATPASSAMLDIVATDKGLLIPRIALTATNVASPVTSPATSLLVYNTATAGTVPNNVVPGYYYWNGTTWVSFLSANTSGWNLTGNNSTNPATNFLGTIDDKSLVMRSNNLSTVEVGNRANLGLVQAYTDYTDGTEKMAYVRGALQFEAPAASFYKPKMWADANGNFRVKGSSAGTDYFEFGSTGTANAGGFEFIIGDDGDEPILFKSYHYINGMSEIMRLQSGRMSVGSNLFDATNPEKLLIDAGATTSYNLMTGKGSIDNYLQINVKNSSATGSASSDLVATANNGNETVNYIDVGINSGSYTNTSYPVLAGANTAYLYATGNDFVIGNGTAGKPIRFFAGGFANSNEAMRVSGAGKVGIGNTNPLEALDVTGNFNLSGAFMPGNTAGTSGYVLTSAGAGATPTWSNPATVISASSWALDGNNVASVKTLGTTSNRDLPFITNNIERMRITSSGNVGVGTSTFNGTNPEKFLVDAGTTTSFNLINAKGRINNYMQLNIQNLSNGTGASSDVVATANNGDETTNYVDMGINSSTYSATGVLGGANNAYLYSAGNDFVIGNSIASKNLLFFTGGTATTDERMRINGSGNVGIANTNPNSTLSVGGSITVNVATKSGAYTVQSTDHVLINTGGGATWTLPAASTCPGRIYRIINQGSGNLTVSRTIRTDSLTTTTSLSFVAGSNNFEIISDGTEWRKIN